MRPHRWHRVARWLALVVGSAVMLAACSTHAALPISPADLASASKFRYFTVYWVGKQFDGVQLTAADNLADFNSGIGFTMYYGDCLSRGTFHTGGCTLPLKVTTVLYTPHSDASFGPQRWTKLHGVPAVVYQGGDDMEIYTDQQSIDIVAATPKLAADAAAALTPFNRKATGGFPAFPPPFFKPNPSQASLDQPSGDTGPTGATGATTDITPPAELEPSPQSGTSQ